MSLVIHGKEFTPDELRNVFKSITKTVDEKRADMSKLLALEPSEHWVKRHPIASTQSKPVFYIPIAITNFLLDTIFLKWWCEILGDVQLVANSVVVKIRLHVEYRDGQGGTVKEWKDGVGAAPVHTAKGFGANDWTAVQAYSVQKALPAAKSLAVKDAAHEYGRIFGRDLNRADAVQAEYSAMATREEDDTVSEFREQCESFNTWSELDDLVRNNPEFDDDMIAVVDRRKMAIKTAFQNKIKGLSIQGLNALWQNNPDIENHDELKALFTNRRIELEKK